jgi:hypothetical protein
MLGIMSICHALCSEGSIPKTSNNTVMKRLTGVALFFLVLLYALWVTSPGDHSHYLNQVSRDVETRFAERQQQADNPRVNGFLDPTLRVYWGREGFEHQAGSKVERSVDSFRDRFSSVATDQVLDHRVLIESTDQESAATTSNFEALLPSLKTALNKPDFVIPETKLSADSPTANLTAFRSLALALSGYCEQLSAEGQLDKSLEHLRLIFQLGDKLVDLENNLPSLTGASIHSIGVQTINGLYGPDANLTASQWKDLANFLLTVRPEDLSTIPHCAEREYYILLQSLDTPESRQQVPALVRLLPGLFQREKRITRNVISDILFNIPLKYSVYSLGFSWDGYLLGDVGFQSSNVTQDAFKVAKELQTIDARLVGYSLCCGLLAYREEMGFFPESLEELKTYGIDLPYYLYGADYKYLNGEVELTLTVWNPESTLLDQGPFFENQEVWAQIEDGRLLFRLQAR